jgi:hypothetical protein
VFKSLRSPERLCINDEKDRERTLSYVRDLIDHVHKFQHAILIDLAHVKFASAAASVLLFAVMNRAYFVLGSKLRVRFSLPKKEENPLGHRCIVRTGLAKALVANTPEKLDALVQQKRYFQSSVTPELALSTTMEMLQEKAVLDDNQAIMLMMGMNEAMLNVRNHAYEHNFYDESVKCMHGKRWWQCAWFDPEQDRVVFIICDLGMGIANSYSGEDLDPVSQFVLEQNSVLEALTSGRSRFNEPNRGNGSEDIKRPIAQGATKKEKLMVFTGGCLYELDSDVSNSHARVSTLRPQIPGTIVLWALTPNRG